MEELYEIENLLKNQFEEYNSDTAIMLLKKAVKENVDVESLKNHIKLVKNWSEWKRDIELIINN